MNRIFMTAAVSAMLIMGSCGGDKATKTTDSALTEFTDTVAPAKSYEITDGGLLSTNGQPILVDFYADWCQPCRQMKPVFDSLANVYGQDIVFLSFNVDDNQELAYRYKVDAIPCFVFIAPDGTVIHKMVGVQKGPDMGKAISGYLQ